MKISATMGMVYLLVVIAGGVYGIVAGWIIFNRQHSSAPHEGAFGKTLVRGLATTVLGLCFLILFWKEKIGALSVILLVGALLVFQEYLLHVLSRSSQKSR